MVRLATITAADSAFVKNQPLTAVFVGATNGIGELTVRELCKTHVHDGPGLRIIVVGRNEKAAQIIINECKAICSTTEFHFVQAGDISLLQSVDKACNEIRQLLDSTKTPGIDILVQSQGRVQFGGRIGKVHFSLPERMLRLTPHKTQRKDSINQCLCSTTHACDSSQTFFQTCSCQPSRPAPKSSPSMQAAWSGEALYTQKICLWTNTIRSETVANMPSS